MAELEDREAELAAAKAQAAEREAALVLARADVEQREARLQVGGCGLGGSGWVGAGLSSAGMGSRPGSGGLGRASPGSRLTLTNRPRRASAGRGR
jgi:multidrug efflux pump subunit AcrA (membrane-fusion protein)